MTRPEQVAQLLMSGLSVDQAAERLGIKLKAVQTNVYHARAVGLLPPVVPKSTPRQRVQAYIQQAMGLKTGSVTKALEGHPISLIDFIIDHQRGDETIADVLVKLAVDAKARRG